MCMGTRVSVCYYINKFLIKTEGKRSVEYEILKYENLCFSVVSPPIHTHTHTRAKICLELFIRWEYY